MWLWLVVAGLAAVGELLSYDLFLAPVAVAAVIVALVALIEPPTNTGGRHGDQVVRTWAQYRPE